MKAIIEPGSICGSIAAPASKSMTQRAYAAALLHSGKTTVRFAGASEDELAALHIIQHLGAAVSDAEGTMTIESSGINPSSRSIDCNESGLCARLFTPIAALSDRPICVTGSGTLLSRPLESIANVLPQLEVSLVGFNGYLPFTIQGPMQAKSITIDAHGSSQFLSGLLFALSYCAQAPLTIRVTGLKSQPYIDLTLQVLAHFGRHITHSNYREFHIDPAAYTYPQNVYIDIEGDWSGAANLLVAGAIAGSVTVSRLHTGSAQADRAILNALQNAGAVITSTREDITVSQAPLHAFEFDATHCPDLFPILAVLAACCHGESSIHGVHRLFHKESNRIESIAEMLLRFGVHFSVEEDALYISGGEKIQGGPIDGFNDHRIVMAAAIAALRAAGPVEISDANPVKKSYPTFFNHLASCGAVLTYQ